MERFQREGGPPAGEGCSRPDLGLTLPRWDELEGPEQAELARHARACPSCGPRLSLLERAEAWIRGGGLGAAPSDPAQSCPPAEDLYELGHGPGARRLEAPRRRRLRAHVRACPECAGFVATLASRPPAPLVVQRRPRLVRLAPLAAAAAVLLALGLWWLAERGPLAGSPGSVGYPAPALLRGEESGALLHPRGRLLSARARREAGLPGLPHFELAPRRGAETYRVTLLRREGDAFEEGSPVARLASLEPHLAPSEELLARLTPGAYTWEAWAVVDGLECPLGRRDFTVVDDVLLARRLRELLEAPEPRRSTEILRELAAAGFDADARAYARTLPPGEARERWMERAPGR